MDFSTRRAKGDALRRLVLLKSAANYVFPSPAFPEKPLPGAAAVDGDSAQTLCEPGSTQWDSDMPFHGADSSMIIGSPAYDDECDDGAGPAQRPNASGMRPLGLSSSTCSPNLRLRGMCFLDKDEWLPAGPSTDGDELAPKFSATDCTVDAPPAACRRRPTVCGFLNSSAANAGSEGPSNLELFVSSFAPVHDYPDLAWPQSLDAVAADASTAVDADAGAVEWPLHSPGVCVRQAPPTTAPSRLRSAVVRLCPIAEDPEAELLEQTEHGGTAAAPPAAPASSAPKLRSALPHGVRSFLLSADAAADGCSAQSPGCSASDCGSGPKTATCSSPCSSPSSLSSRPGSPDSHSALDGPSAACSSQLCRRSLSSPLDSAGADGPAGSSPTTAPAVTASPRSGDWPEVPERRSDGHMPSLSEPLYTIDGCAQPGLQQLAGCSRSLSSPLIGAEVPNVGSRKRLMAGADLELVDYEAAAPPRRGLLAHLPFTSCFGAPAVRPQPRRGAAAAPPPPQPPPQPTVEVAPCSAVVTSDDLEPPSPSDYWLSLAAAQAAPPAPPPPPPALVDLIRRGSVSRDDLVLTSEALSLGAELGDLLQPAGAASRRLTRSQVCGQVAALLERALAAARAVTHGSLAELAEEVVLRYADPRRGCPEEAVGELLLEACGARGPGLGFGCSAAAPT